MFGDVSTPGMANALVQFLFFLSGAAVLGAALGWNLQKRRRERTGLELQSLQDRFKRLQGAAADRDAQRTGLLRRVEALQRREKELSDELEARKRAADNQPSALKAPEADDALLQQLHKARKRAEELEERLSEKAEQEHNSQQELISSLQGAIQSLQEETESLKGRIQDLIGQKDELERQLSLQQGNESNPEEAPQDINTPVTAEGEDQEVFTILSEDRDKEERTTETPVAGGEKHASRRGNIEDAPVLSRGYDLSVGITAAKAVSKISPAAEGPAVVPEPGNSGSEYPRSLPEHLLSPGHGEKDDLTAIVGIGPFIEARLNTIGITNYGQLAQMEEEDIELVTRLIAFFPGRIQRDGWVRQASKLLRKKKKQ